MKYNIHEIKDMIDRHKADEDLSIEERSFLFDHGEWFLPEYQNIAWAYLVQEMSLTQIAEHFPFSPRSVLDRLNDLGVESRSKSEGEHLRVGSHCNINKVKEVITGNLLGDGCVTTISDFSGGFNLSTIHQEYASHLKGIYETSGMKVNIIERAAEERDFEGKTGKCKKLYNLYTNNCEELKDFRNKWYPNGTKIVPKDISLTPRVRYYWYIDDGSNASLGGLNLYTNGFEKDDVLWLQEKLKNREIETTINEVGKQTDQWYLYVLKKSQEKFVEHGNQLDCFSYKFDQA